MDNPIYFLLVWYFVGFVLYDRISLFHSACEHLHIALSQVQGRGAQLPQTPLMLKDELTLQVDLLHPCTSLPSPGFISLLPFKSYLSSGPAPSPDPRHSSLLPSAPMES